MDKLRNIVTNWFIVAGLAPNPQPLNSNPGATSYLMKYPDTCHCPSLSSIGVTVSIADFLLAKLVS